MRKYRQGLMFRIYRAFKFYHGPGNEERHRKLALIYGFSAWNAAGLALYMMLSSDDYAERKQQLVQLSKDQGTFLQWGLSPRKQKEEPGWEDLEEFPGETMKY